MQIKELHSQEEVLSSLPVIIQIYPEINQEEYVDIVLNMMQRGYKMAAVFEGAKDDKKIGECIGVVGIRVSRRLQHNKVLEIEDFMICRKKRGIGVGKMLIRWVEWQALTFKCDKIIGDLDSKRLESHKILSRERFILEGFHFRKDC